MAQRQRQRQKPKPKGIWYDMVLNEKIHQALYNMPRKEHAIHLFYQDEHDYLNEVINSLYREYDNTKMPFTQGVFTVVLCEHGMLLCVGERENYLIDRIMSKSGKMWSLDKPILIPRIQLYAMYQHGQFSAWVIHPAVGAHITEVFSTAVGDVGSICVSMNGQATTIEEVQDKGKVVLDSMRVINVGSIASIVGLSEEHKRVIRAMSMSDIKQLEEKGVIHAYS